MSGERINQALARIEAATARIAAAGTRASPVDSALSERHEALRAAVRQSLQEMDTLLGKGAS